MSHLAVSTVWTGGEDIIGNVTTCGFLGSCPLVAFAMVIGGEGQTLDLGLTLAICTWTPAHERPRFANSRWRRERVKGARYTRHTRTR
jgi:hypothetical protein